MTSVIKDMILLALDIHNGRIVGIFNLGANLIGTQNIPWVREQLHRLETEKQITIEDHGNGRAKVIKRNRNSPGYARRVRRC